MEERHKPLLLVFLLVLFAYLSFLLLKPFLSYVILGLILAFLWYPVHRWLAKDVGESWAAFLSIIIILLIIIIPAGFLTVNLIGQANNAYHAALQSGITSASIFDQLQEWTSFDIAPYFNEAVNASKSFAAATVPRLITGTSNFFIGMVLFFFVFYYTLKDGKEWYHAASGALPLKKTYKRRLEHDIESMTRSLFYGQVLTAMLIGLGCGIIFAAFSITNPIFWGFVMMILAFLPLLGAPIVYVPAGIILVLKDHWVAGISVIILCTLFIFLVEYIIRPKFVSKTSTIHPLIVIIGALGGIYLLGFAGFLIGPLILGIFTTLLGFDYSES